MSGPRFVLVSGVLASGARRTTWPDRSGLAGETAAGGRWVAWRLLGRNNHELGRSAVVFPTPAHVEGDLTELRLNADAVTVTLVADGEMAEWRWRLQLAGRLVAVSSRSYLRQRECQYSATMFRQAVPDAASPPAPETPRQRRRAECLR